MRVPFKTEGDAFRVAIALAGAVAIALVVAWLASVEYGIVALAAALAAGVAFELSGRESGQASTLRHALSEPHPHGMVGGGRHVLVIASAPLGGDELLRALATEDGGRVELDVLAPVLASRFRFWASDVDRERTEAQRRLDASLAWAAAHGLAARGEVGDADPLLAIEDELREYGADEVIVTAPAGDRRSWLADRMLAHLEEELDVPVRVVVIGEAAA